jgi:hypothetical protein
MSPSDWTLLQSVALASLLAWASGLRLYLLLFVLGIAAQQGLITLPEALKVLAHPYVIGASGVLLAVEFFADKIPGIDSAWDALHTFIRIPAGAMLAAGVAGDGLNAITVAAGLLGGTITAGTHFAKAGGRAMINTSPEPFSNWVASFTEDAVVLGAIWFAFQHPAAFLAALAIFLVLAAWFLVHFARLARRWLSGRAEGATQAGAR